MFADYRVPQLLRDAGVMVYSDHLAAIVDQGIELPAGSEEETQIRYSSSRSLFSSLVESASAFRCATVHVVELLTLALNKMVPISLLPIHRPHGVTLFAFAREAVSSAFRSIGCCGKGAKASASRCGRTIARGQYFTKTSVLGPIHGQMFSSTMYYIRPEHWAVLQGPAVIFTPSCSLGRPPAASHSSFNCTLHQRAALACTASTLTLPPFAAAIRAAGACNSFQQLPCKRAQRFYECSYPSTKP